MGPGQTHMHGLHVEFSKNPGHEALSLGALGSPWEGTHGSPWGDLNLLVFHRKYKKSIYIYIYIKEPGDQGSPKPY